MKIDILKKSIIWVITQAFILQSIVFAADVTAINYDSCTMLSPQININSGMFQNGFSDFSGGMMSEFSPITDWQKSFDKISNDKAEEITVLFDKGDLPAYKFSLKSLKINTFTSEDMLNDLAGYLATCIYNRIGPIGAERVLVNAPDRLYQKIEASFNQRFDSDEMKKGNRAISGYLTYLNKKPFEFKSATQEELDYVSSKGEFSFEDTKAKAVLNQGNLIGVDLGGTSIKVVAISNGRKAKETSIAWTPQDIMDPQEHIKQVEEAIRAVLPALNGNIDAIGVSWAGAVADGKIAAGGPITKKLTSEQINWLKENLNSELSGKFNDCLVNVSNDGSSGVFGATSGLGLNNAVGFGFGTGLAFAYVDKNGNLNNKILGEGGNVVIDMNPNASRHTYTGVPGVLQRYLSQGAVVEQAENMGIKEIDNVDFQDKAGIVGELLNAGDPRALVIFENIGRYLAVAIAEYSRYFNMENVVIFGGVTTGRSGEVIRDTARKILAEEFPEVKVKIYITSEQKYGGAIGAAKLANSLRKKDRVLVFGGPDGVLLKKSAYHNTTLADSPVRDSLLKLLRDGTKIVILSRQRYEDDHNTNEQGLYSRLIKHIPENLRKNITLYVSMGAYKIGFDKFGKEKTDLKFNSTRNLDDIRYFGTLSNEIKPVINEVINEYWNKHLKSPGDLQKIYPAFPLRKPEIVEHKYDGQTYAVTVMYLPSAKATKAYLNKGQLLDERDIVFNEIKSRVNAKYENYWDAVNIEKEGATSIDFYRKVPGSEDYPLEDYFTNTNAEVVYYGNLDNYSKNERIDSENTDNLGMVVGSLWTLVDSDINVQAVNMNINSYKRDKNIEEPTLSAALDHLDDMRNTLQWNNLPMEKRIEDLYEIYKDFNLCFTNQAAWTFLYRHAFNFDVNMNTAIADVAKAFDEAPTIEAFFNKVDDIYTEYKRLGALKNEKFDFFRFYSSVDPRLARNLHFLRMRVYKNNTELIADIEKSKNFKNESMSRTLIGYFQDSYIYAIKPSGVEDLKKPAPKVTYVGGGGVATTTFLRELVQKNMKSVAALVSSSDDGGSSWNVMYAIAKKFGFYFIPPGDAAGVMIFTGADDAKVFSLFEIETKKGLPEELSTAGKRITAKYVLPVWQRRIMDVFNVLNGIVKTPNSPAKPDDFIAFVSGLMTLGDLIDRELLDTKIMELKGMSTANLLIMGAAFDRGAIKSGQLFNQDTMKLDNLDRLLGAKEQQTLAVSWDYARSCLLATYEDGKEKIPFQTIITDRLHPQFLNDLDFAHRIRARENYSEYKNKKEMLADTVALDNGDYPRANPEVVKAINDTQDVIMMGNGSLFTSMLPNLLYGEISKAIIERRKQGIPVVFIVKIKADLETSKNIRIVDDKGKVYENAEDFKDSPSNSKFYLEIGATMSLEKQLEIIRNIVEKSIKRDNPDVVRDLLGKDKLELKDIISHIIMPDKAFSDKLAADPDSNRVFVEGGQEEAIKLNNSLQKGEAQVSKKVKGSQQITDADRDFISREGITVIPVSSMGITGIADKKPMYNNEVLYNITKELIEGKEKSKILAVCNSNYNRSPAMEMVLSYLANQVGLTNNVIVSSGAVSITDPNSLGGINENLKSAFMDQFLGETPVQVESKRLTAYQVQEADVIIVPTVEIKNKIENMFSYEIKDKQIFVLDDLAKDMQLVQPIDMNKDAETLFKTRQIIETKIWPKLLKSLTSFKAAEPAVGSGVFKLKTPSNIPAELIGSAI